SKIFPQNLSAELLVCERLNHGQRERPNDRPGRHVLRSMPLTKPRHAGSNRFSPVSFQSTRGRATSGCTIAGLGGKVSHAANVTSQYWKNPLTKSIGKHKRFASSSKTSETRLASLPLHNS